MDLRTFTRLLQSISLDQKIEGHAGTWHVPYFAQVMKHYAHCWSLAIPFTMVVAVPMISAGGIGCRMSAGATIGRQSRGFNPAS